MFDATNKKPSSFSHQLPPSPPNTMLNCYETQTNIDRWGSGGGFINIVTIARIWSNNCKCRQCFGQDCSIYNYDVPCYLTWQAARQKKIILSKLSVHCRKTCSCWLIFLNCSWLNLWRVFGFYSSYLRGSVVRTLHRHRKGVPVRLLPEGLCSEFDEFFSPVPG